MPQHVLIVTATDGGPDPIPIHATVTIDLLDVNDHIPDITVNILSTSGNVELEEENEAGRFLSEEQRLSNSLHLISVFSLCLSDVKS